VMKSPIAATHAHETIHEGAVLAILERAREEHKDKDLFDLGAMNLPLLVAAAGVISPKSLEYTEGVDSESQSVARRAASKRSLIGMSFGGQNLADYHNKSVDAVRSGEMHPMYHLARARKIGHDIFKAVHFLAEYGHMCHRDLKMFNLGVEPPFSIPTTECREEPTASLFDFGTCYPCDYIPDMVFGTNAYHPPEADRMERRKPTDEIIKDMKDFYEGYLMKLYDKDAKAALLYDKEEGRFDKPEGSSDVFGCGALLAEMIFGISERCPVTGGNWTHLLFTMSDPEAKVELLTTFRDSQDPQAELAKLMKGRCEFPEHFHPVIDQAMAMGAGDLMLKCFEMDPNKRITAEETLKHPFWTATLTVNGVEY